MKVYLNNLNESWVVDRFKDEWEYCNSDISTKNIKEADIIWIFTPWLWKNIKKRYLKKQKVLCSIYHIDFEKFTPEEKKEFYNKDDMENIKIVEATTQAGFKKNSFIHEFMSSMRQKINDPLGVRAKKRKEISQR